MSPNLVGRLNRRLEAGRLEVGRRAYGRAVSDRHIAEIAVAAVTSRVRHTTSRGRLSLGLFTCSVLTLAGVIDKVSEHSFIGSKVFIGP